MKQFTPVRANLSSINGVPLELPNHSRGKAPESDKGLVNKEYVDDAISAIPTIKYTDAEAVTAVATADDYLKNDADDTTTGTLTANKFISTATSGDVIFIDPLNANINLYHVSTGSSDYGFYLQYYGAGSGNNNALRLYTEGELGTDKWVYEVKQDGIFAVKQSLTSAGAITAGTNVYSGYAGTFSSVASDVHIAAGGGTTIYMDDDVNMSTNAITNAGAITGTSLNAGDGFTGTGAYTNFTIVNGIITGAS